MKRYTLLILATVLSMLGIQTASAQQTQDALYIYRNDGGFNGFFFSDIERIEYSKVDTLGVEHDDYVVQEVYALDSLIRIPLTAIDSVTFVTPETIYKKDVVHTTESDLWNYVIGSDSIKMLILASNTPAAMIPKTGDKIVTTKSRDFLPGGFYGLVQSVQNGAQGIIVNCEVPPFTDLFDQWICKVAAVGESSDDASRPVTRSENNSQITFVVPQYAFYTSLIGGDIQYAINDNWSLKGSGSLSFGVIRKINLRAFMAIRWQLGMNLDVTQRTETTSWFDLKMKGEVGGQIDFHTYLLNGYQWIPNTPFAVEWEGGFSVSASGSVDLDIHRKHVTSAYQLVQFNDSFYDDSENSQCSESFSTLANEASTSLTGNVSATAGPYFSVYLSLAKKEIGKIGLRFDAGLKASASVELKMTDYLFAAVPSVLPAYMLLNPTAQYDQINRDGTISFGKFFKCDFEAQLANLKTLKYTNTLYDNSEDPENKLDFSGGLVPKFSETKVSYDKDNRRLTAEAALMRETAFGNKVGFAIYYAKSGKLAASELYKTKYTLVGEKTSFNKWSQDFDNIGGGKELTIYPIVTPEPFKCELLASPYTSYTIPAEMEVTPETYDFQRKGGVVKIAVEDNLDRKEDTYERKAEIDIGVEGVEPWLTGYWSGDNYVVKAEENGTDDARSAIIKFSTFNKDKSINLEKTINIQQFARQVPDLVTIEKGTKFYSSDYCLSFSENSDGHTINIGLYTRTETTFTYKTCLSGVYTADGSRMEITIDNFPEKVNDADNPFASLGLKKGDVIVVTYSQSNEEFKLDLNGYLLSFWPPIILGDIYWKSTDGLARFELKDGTWSRYYCYISEYSKFEYQFMAILEIDQSKKTLRFRISTNDKTKILLPTQNYYERDKSITYVCPFSLERIEGIRTLSFTLFGHNFALQACDPW